MSRYLDFLFPILFILLALIFQPQDSRDSKSASERSKVPALTLCYLSSKDSSYLEQVLVENRKNPDRHLGLVEFAEFIVNKRVPNSAFKRSRLEFLLANRGRLTKCLLNKLKPVVLSLPAQGLAQFRENDWIPSDLYVEGLFKLIRGIPLSNQALKSIIEPLYLNNGETVADIGFADGQLTLAIAKEVGLEGKAIGIERSPALVDFLNFMSEELKLPQMEGRLYVHTDIIIPSNTLDAAFMRFVFSDVRDVVQPWVNSIFKAMKPGGRVVILQHYSPKKVQKNQELIERFLAGGELPVSPQAFCCWRSPEVVKKLCTNAGFKVHLLRKEVEPNHVYLFEVRKPGRDKI